MNKYVMLLEIGRKQKYIFSSNKLAENIGASIIIRNATERDAQAIYRKNEAADQPQVIYEGGGNCLYVFQSKEAGDQFAREYSRYIIGNYPGITLYLVGTELGEKEDGPESVKDGITRCYKLLNEKKNSREHTAEVIDFGNTVRCASTNLPASPKKRIHIPEDLKKKTNFSAESLKKYETAGEEQDISFRDLLPEREDGMRWAFPHRLDDLGRSVDEKSYIAVVHIDGNRMGQKIAAFNKDVEQGVKPGQGDVKEKEKKETFPETLEEFDQRYIRELGKLSREIREKYKEAFQETVQVLANNMAELRESLDIVTEGNKEYLPIRPLIMAGDDICFVTDGRIGIDITRVFLEAIRKKEIQGMTMNACGGVAIVKAHFPFSRAYDLAEELCENGKNAIGGENAPDASYLDWHIDQGELDEGLAAIRSNYQIGEKMFLNMRPYRVGDRPNLKGDNDEALYYHFTDAMQIIQDTPRSKVKGYRDIAHRGLQAGEYYLKSNKLDETGEKKKNSSKKAEVINETVGLHCTHWKSGEGGFAVMKDGTRRHMFYDAMEAMDVYIELEENNGEV